MIKLVACDLDETLLTKDKKISEKDELAIKSLKDKDVKFVVATGRSTCSIDPIWKQLDLYEKENEYTIGMNGGIIVENKDRKVLYQKSVDRSSQLKVFEIASKYDVGVYFYGLENVYGARLPDGEKEIQKNRKDILQFPFEELTEVVRYIPIFKMSLVKMNDYDYLMPIGKIIEENVENVSVSYSSNRYCEITYKGISKGPALEFLCDYLGIDKSETMAIGDNYNDLTMLKSSGLAVGVANTIEAMKSECDYITERTNNESAVSEALEKFVL